MEETTKPIPSLYEWAGGMPAFEVLFTKFYDKVLQDPLLEPVFKHMSPEHRQHVAHFVAEVLGGPTLYSDTDDGSHFKMISKHLSKHLTQEHRKRWVELLLETADEISLPDDPEFRSAFVAYLEWGTRIAVINSQLDNVNIDDQEPMPNWGWGVPGGPYMG
ncbi:group II truncated hemoglobin [Mucilaginibacter myungsuensis]|uniref:Globin n=1 Tax=Mucilaginibacter myungsuensis TaxID=649104 RepID=A0A929KTX5_9SPHI|nr:group II truncated hemoglobin [Mucilaginibacter myungsuensis]MBE9660722.1 globin [Mucilaginibacter myungsuensis]MDN3600767.1 group II truncated hemoglobin [Mucilaginibacter myungsuensis]